MRFNIVSFTFFVNDWIIASIVVFMPAIERLYAFVKLKDKWMV
jgi:hypothetical protein